MNDRNVNKAQQLCAVYTFFLFLINPPKARLFFFFHRFLNGKFANKFNVIWILFEKQIIYYSIFIIQCYNSTAKIETFS